MSRSLAILFCAAALCGAAALGSQPLESGARIRGTSLTGSLQLDSARRVVTDTLTLTFSQRGAHDYIVEFVSRRPLDDVLPATGVVDLVVTEESDDDDHPRMDVEADGQTIPVVSRLRSRRSIVATLSVPDFERLARAGEVVDRTFGVTLELTPAQMATLRRTAERWLGQ